MAQILLPKNLHPDFRLPGVKPTGAVAIDWSHPLARDLIGCWGFGSEVNLADISAPAVPEGGLRYFANALQFDATAAAFSRITGASSKYDKSRNATIVSVFNTDTTGTYRALFSCTAGGMYLRITNNNNLNFLRSNVANIVTGIKSIDANKTYAAAVTVSPDATTTAKIYCNGLFDNSATYGSAMDGARDHQNIGADTGSPETHAEEFSGKIYATYFYDRELTEAEAKAITANPYQFLRPAAPLFYFPSEGPPPVSRRRFVITG